MALRPLPRELPVPDASEAQRLADVERRLAALEAWIAAHGSGPRDGADVRLLGVVAASTAGVPFTCRSLYVHLALSDDVALRDALEAADIANPIQLGRWLQRLVGVHAGFAVMRDVGPRDGRLWQVARQ